MPRYRVVVDTVELHTRRYWINATTQRKAEQLVREDMYDGNLECDDSFEEFAPGSGHPKRSFEVVESYEVEGEE